MARKPFRDYLRTLLTREARPEHKFGHQPRLYALTRQIGEELSYDDDVVFAAVWLHDLGVFEGNRPSTVHDLERWDHVHYATDRAAALLPETDFPHEKIAHVLRVIEEHQPKDTPTSLEATIVRDADILEQLGSVAVMRTAAKLGSDTRFIHFSDARDSLARQLNELPAKLQLASSRKLAEPRRLALESFLASLNAEAGTELW